MIADFTLTDEQQAIRTEVRSFVDEHVRPLDLTSREWRPDPSERIPWEAVDAAGDAGLNMLTIPDEFDGRDASHLAVCTAAEELATGDLGLAVILDQNWKIARIIDEFAKRDVREEVFEAYASDPRHLLASASTEPANGSNNVLPYEEGRYNTVAEKDGDEWVLNGKKAYISNGADAKTYVVRAQTDPEVPHHQAGATAFRVPGDVDGLEVTEVHEKFSQRTINNATFELNDVRVHERNVLGEVGEGMSVVGEALHGSHIEAGATTIGAARAALTTAFEYATNRRQAGTEIINHQSIGHDFAEMTAELQAARSLIWLAARAVDQGDSYTPEMASMAKYQAAETAANVCRRSMEKFGGAGIMLDNPIQKYYRDAVSFLHSDGTQEVHKHKILEGLRRSHRE